MIKLGGLYKFIDSYFTVNEVKGDKYRIQWLGMDPTLDKTWYGPENAIFDRRWKIIEDCGLIELLVERRD